MSETFDPAAYPRRLNLGCGFDHRDGYLNVDFQDFHSPDLVADVRDLAMLPDGYYDEIVAQDVLEHLYRHDVGRALNEWSRLLAVGGTLVLRVPDVIGLARLLSAHRTLEMQQTLVQNLFGTQAYTGDYHHVGFTEMTLRAALADAGFGVRSLEHRDDWLFDAVAERLEHPRPADFDGLRFMDLHDSVEEPAPAEVGPMGTADPRGASLSRSVEVLSGRARSVISAARRRIVQRLRAGRGAGSPPGGDQRAA